MDKWIEEMEKSASQKGYCLGYLFEEVLYWDDDRVDWMTGDKEITLHGDFTIQQLTGLINHMKKYTKEEE